MAAERSYRAGQLRELGVRERSDLALELLTDVADSRSVVIGGATYGCNSRFLEAMRVRGLEAVVEVRPSTPVLSGNVSTIASELISRANWHSHRVAVAGQVDQYIEYTVAQLARGSLRSSPEGVLFAAQTGGINGLHPGTIFGFSLAAGATIEQLIQSVGWARWIRPLVRRSERLISGTEDNGSAQPDGTIRADRTRLRANITLSRRQDEASAASRVILSGAPRYARTLANDPRCLNVVELFAGAGGMGLGFLLAGKGAWSYRLVYAGEADPVYVQTLRRNHTQLAHRRGDAGPITPGDIKPIDLRAKTAMDEVAEVAGAAGGADIVIGGPPCQGFSNANRNSWHSSNPHNELIDVYLHYVKRLTPRVFLLENVQGIHWTRNNGGPRARVLDHIRNSMEAAGYDVFVQLLDAVWYGVPQYRSRFFVLGIHRDLGYKADAFGSWGPFPQPTHGPGTAFEYVTVWDAIGDLPRVGNGHAKPTLNYSEPKRDVLAKNQYLAFLRDETERAVLTDHVTSNHAPYVIERYRMIPPGGNWANIADRLTNYSDVRRTHSNIYRRLLWDDPSITIGHYRKSMLVHPSQHRGLSLREASRLQSFPDWFRFAGDAAGGSGGLVHKQQQLANAVCPLVTRAIANLIVEL